MQNLDAFVWMFLPLFVAAGSALLAFYIMQARMEVAIAKERESLAEARATINTHKITIEERVRATEEATRRKAMDEFMQEFRVEERSYMRESKTMFSNKKLMVMQERLFFRNIPLSNWIEHEMLIEEGRDLGQLPKESVFSAGSLAAPVAFPAAVAPAAEKQVTLAKLLEDSRPVQEPSNVTVLTHHATAFGAQ